MIKSRYFATFAIPCSSICARLSAELVCKTDKIISINRPAVIQVYFRMIPGAAISFILFNISYSTFLDSVKNFQCRFALWMGNSLVRIRWYPETVCLPCESELAGIFIKVQTKALAEWGEAERELIYLKRAPEALCEKRRKTGVLPRNIDHEIVEIMHRTHMGVDQDYKNLIKQGTRAALADGWGGSMMATDLQDVLFGTPFPLESEANPGRWLKVRLIAPSRFYMTLSAHLGNIFIFSR